MGQIGEWERFPSCGGDLFILLLKYPSAELAYEPRAPRSKIFTYGDCQLSLKIRRGQRECCIGDRVAPE